MDRDVKIRLSVGLIGVVALHALLLAAVFTGLHHADRDPVAPWIDQLSPPCYQPPTQFREPTNTAPLGPRVNPALNELKSAAGTLDEVKGQRRWVTCQNCQPSYTVNQPYYPPVAVRPTRPAPTVVQPSQPAPAAVQPPFKMPDSIPAPAIPAPAAAPALAAKRPQIALFIDESTAGQRLLNWWNTAPDMVALRKQCDFQVYTPNNALYQTRYAEIVPIEQFPAILFLKPDGGHIHAAGGHMLPTTHEQLYADLQASYKLMESVENAPGPATTGALRERGYNWDKAISQSELSGQIPRQISQCPPGMVCPDQERVPLLPRFFDQQPDRSAVLWAGGSEIVMAILALAAVLLIGVILFKRL